MFPISGPMCVSEDAGLFQVVMSTFYQHEQMVCDVYILNALRLTITARQQAVIPVCMYSVVT